ncbi:uncharacterized protein LOC131953356 isoform X2 [Physella acuta]|uniref:uncharacterized protein LOC131953356 isoform X2 n=1 Tax=Physella acuta TaxID=109671 RepID=UPI0027DDE592|nr:uncharacterized protein LOC131953356 isoform X2 [Physella acuta]
MRSGRKPRSLVEFNAEDEQAENKLLEDAGIDGYSQNQMTEKEKREFLAAILESKRESPGPSTIRECRPHGDAQVKEVLEVQRKSSKRSLKGDVEVSREKLRKQTPLSDEDDFKKSPVSKMSIGKSKSDKQSKVSSATKKVDFHITQDKELQEGAIENTFSGKTLPRKNMSKDTFSEHTDPNVGGKQQCAGRTVRSKKALWTDSGSLFNKQFNTDVKQDSAVLKPPTLDTINETSEDVACGNKGGKIDARKNAVQNERAMKKMQSRTVQINLCPLSEAGSKCESIKSDTTTKCDPNSRSSRRGAIEQLQPAAQASRGRSSTQSAADSPESVYFCEDEDDDDDDDDDDTQPPDDLMSDDAISVPSKSLSSQHYAQKSDRHNEELEMEEDIDEEMQTNDSDGEKANTATLSANAVPDFSKPGSSNKMAEDVVKLQPAQPAFSFLEQSGNDQMELRRIYPKQIEQRDMGIWKYILPPEGVKHPDRHAEVVKLVFDIYHRRLRRAQEQHKGELLPWGRPVLPGPHHEGCLVAKFKGRKGQSEEENVRMYRKKHFDNLASRDDNSWTSRSNTEHVKGLVDDPKLRKPRGGQNTQLKENLDHRRHRANDRVSNVRRENENAGSVLNNRGKESATDIDSQKHKLAIEWKQTERGVKRNREHGETSAVLKRQKKNDQDNGENSDEDRDNFPMNYSNNYSSSGPANSFKVIDPNRVKFVWSDDETLPEIPELNKKTDLTAGVGLMSPKSRRHLNEVSANLGNFHLTLDDDSSDENIGDNLKSSNRTEEKTVEDNPENSKQSSSSQELSSQSSNSLLDPNGYVYSTQLTNHRRLRNQRDTKSSHKSRDLSKNKHDTSSPSKTRDLSRNERDTNSPSKTRDLSRNERDTNSPPKARQLSHKLKLKDSENEKKTTDLDNLTRCDKKMNRKVSKTTKTSLKGKDIQEIVDDVNMLDVAGPSHDAEKSSALFKDRKKVVHIDNVKDVITAPSAQRQGNVLGTKKHDFINLETDEIEAADPVDEQLRGTSENKTMKTKGKKKAALKTKKLGSVYLDAGDTSSAEVLPESEINKSVSVEATHSRYFRKMPEEAVVPEGARVASPVPKMEPCPICNKNFSLNKIEAHAATCGEDLNILLRATRRSQST